MNQISEKELSALNDLLSGEELLIKKFQVLADNSTDTEIKAKFTEISNEQYAAVILLRKRDVCGCADRRKNSYHALQYLF